MKKTLLFCAIAAMVMVSCGKTESQTTTTVPNQPIQIEDGCRLPVAVVNIDTLLNNYNLAIEANESLIKRQEDARLDLNQRARSLQNEMVEFQKKLENQAFLSRERAENEQRRLMQKDQELQALEQQKTQELMIEQQNLSIRMRDSINNAIQTLNADGRYHLVISTSVLSDNVLFSAPEYDITQEVIQLLNKRYNKGK